MRAYIELPHTWAVLIVMLATALFGLLATGGQPAPDRFALLLVAMFGGQIAIGALNEYCDRDLDALTKPHKPIPAGLVPPQVALGITGVALLLMLLAGTALGGWPLLLVALGTGCGLVYDLWLKRTRWSWLPYLIALPLLPIWVWVSLARFEPRLLLLYPIGALMVLAVHLAQSLPDAESDRAAGVHSLAARLGRGRSLAVAFGAAILSAAAVALSGALLGERPVLAIGSAGVVVLALMAALATRQAAPMHVDRHLFKVMTACAVVLGTGWVLAAVV